MEKSNNSSGDEEYYSCVARDFEVKFFLPGLNLRYFRAGAESACSTKALGTQRRTKKCNKVVCINLWRLSMRSGYFRENFWRQ